MDNPTKTNGKSVDSTSNELIQFINKERINKKVNFKKTFRYFSKCLKKSIFEMHDKFADLSNQNESTISGINMIYHIYFILVSYSNNIKLTIFLLERAILLYTEFIIMSQDKKMVDEIYFVPNINDAVSFSFKKTIGSIVVNDIENISKNPNANFNSKFLKESSIILRNIYKLFFRTKWINEETSFISLKIEENIESIDKMFQDKNIISEQDLDEFKKYSAMCTEQSLRDTILFSDNDTIVGDQNPIFTENYKITINDFLNIINNEIVESLLALNTNKKYSDILKKINCIITNDDTISDKLGKIKIILFIYNKEYNNIKYNRLLFTNDLYKYLIKLKENILIEELRERLFDIIVYFNFTNKFKHNIDNEPTNLGINISYIEKQLDELLNFSR
jgi:hypothetical protein